MDTKTSSTLVVSASLFAFGFAATKLIAVENVPEQDPYAARKLFYEEHWQSKIESALEYVDGAKVAVNVTLSTDVEKTIMAEEFDERTLAEFEATRAAKSHAERGGNPNTEQGPSNDQSTKEQESYVKYVIPRTEVKSVVAGLTPQKVAVTVSVPSSYYEAIWRQRQRLYSKDLSQPEEIRQEILAIQETVERSIVSTVAMLLPNQASEDPTKMVRVTTFENFGVKRLETAGGRPLKQNDVVTVLFDGQWAELDVLKHFPPSDGTSSRIAAKIEKFQPNGNALVKVRRTVGSNENLRFLELTGEIHPEQLHRFTRAFRTSEIANLRIHQGELR